MRNRLFLVLMALTLSMPLSRAWADAESPNSQIEQMRAQGVVQAADTQDVADRRSLKVTGVMNILPFQFIGYYPEDIFRDCVRFCRSTGTYYILNLLVFGEPIHLAVGNIDAACDRITELAR